MEAPQRPEVVPSSKLIVAVLGARSGMESFPSQVKYHQSSDWGLLQEAFLPSHTATGTQLFAPVGRGVA